MSRIAAAGPDYFLHQLIQVSKEEFDELPAGAVGVPVYFLEYQGKILVWPKAEPNICVCRLVPLEE